MSAINNDAARPLPVVPQRLIVEFATAAFVIVIVTLLRLIIDRLFPGVVPYALLFPAIILATIFAGARSGAMVLIGGQLLVWYFIVPVKGQLRFATKADFVGLVLTTFAQALLLWSFASFRRSERNALQLQQRHSHELELLVARLQDQASVQEQALAQEIALRETRQNLEAIYQSSADGLALCEATFDGKGRVIEYQALEVNRAHGELTAATREEMLTKPVSTIAPPIDPRWFETAEKVLKTGVMHDFDIRSPATGRWLNVRTSRVSDKLFQQTFVDVSDRHRLEEQRRMLLLEMSHRVMNNFQMVSGFLQLQAASSGPAAAAQLNTAARRVHVLANLHSMLAYSQSEGAVDAAAYIKELCDHLPSTFPRPDAVLLVSEADPVPMPPDKIVALGFIISELVTNSAKYAYPAPMSGSISVSFHGTPDRWILTIIDCGQGFQEAALKSKGGLGTRLVRRFVQQLRAELITTSDQGVEHRIVFPGPAADVET